MLRTVARNYINLEHVQVAFSHKAVLDDVSLGLNEADRIGIVGRNGGGKSTLLRVLSGASVDSGRVTHAGGLRVGMLAQVGDPAPGVTIRMRVIGDQLDHEWAADGKTRDVLTGLLGGFEDAVLDRELTSLSGGELRRVELAHLLIDGCDVLLLDEPTNHLDLEAVAWLARHLKGLRSTALAVVTHDRWFLDEVTDRTWEVIRGQIEEYDGGYSAYVLAKAERSRQDATMEARRANLLRKELAWLRRGPPARTTKPKFRIDAANSLIATEPPPRNDVELVNFASARLGRTVMDAQDISVTLGDRELIHRLTWSVGPGDRVGILGPNGAGKTTLIRTLLGDQRVDSGKVVIGKTVKPAYLSQHLDELNPNLRVLEAVQEVAEFVDLGKGREMSASTLCERLGFDAGSQWTPVGDLSGGERRRLQLTRLLMSGPNVLILDEPTNDFDVETLAALEDLLDGFAGTILIVSHDRYFIERVCETYRAVLGDGDVRDLPGGVDEYLALRSASLSGSRGPATKAQSTPTARVSELSAAERREINKQVASLERKMMTAQEKVAVIHQLMQDHATDHDALRADGAALRKAEAKLAEIEMEWYAALELLN
jgi:ATP-binding cassette subfamily F protein uup